VHQVIVREPENLQENMQPAIR